MKNKITVCERAIMTLRPTLTEARKCAICQRILITHDKIGKFIKLPDWINCKVQFPSARTCVRPDYYLSFFSVTHSLYIFRPFSVQCACLCCLCLLPSQQVIASNANTRTMSFNERTSNRNAWFIITKSPSIGDSNEHFDSWVFVRCSVVDTNKMDGGKWERKCMHCTNTCTKTTYTKCIVWGKYK